MKEFFKRHSILITIVISIISIIIGNAIQYYKLVIGGILLLALYGFIFIILLLLDIIDNSINKKIQKKYESIVCKDDISLWESLYVKAYKNTADDEIVSVINRLQIKGINNVEVISGIKPVTLNYRHKGFLVYISIFENELIYRTDTPEKFDFVDDNDNFEKINRVDLSINSYNNLDEFYVELSNLMIKINESIDLFEDSNIDKISLKSTKISDIKRFRRENKIEGILILVLSIFLIVPFIFISYYCCLDLINGEYPIILGILALGIMDGFIIFSTTYSIFMLIKVRKISLDLGNQQLLKISGKPAKVIIGTEKYKHSKNIYMRYIKLVFLENGKRYPLTMICDYHCKKLHKKQIKIKIKDANYNIQYLRNSLIIVSGVESICSIIKKNIEV